MLHQPKLDSVLPLLDLMAANHVVRLGMKIPPALKRAMGHRHSVLAGATPLAYLKTPSVAYSRACPPRQEHNTKPNGWSGPRT